MEINHMGAGQLGAANTGFSSGLNSGFGAGLQDFQVEPDKAIDSSLRPCGEAEGKLQNSKCVQGPSPCRNRYDRN